MTTLGHDGLIAAVDALLDCAVHSDACYIDPDNTTCVCLIGKVRAALPQCEATLSAPGSPRLWRCTRPAHPASPPVHVFGEA